MAKRKKRPPKLTGCPRCGSPWQKQSGIMRCSNQSCGYAPSLFAEHYAQPDKRPREFERIMPTSGSDGPEFSGNYGYAKHPAGLRSVPLTGKGKR